MRITLNGCSIDTDQEFLTYDDIVSMVTNPRRNALYTIVYSRMRGDCCGGSICPGQNVQTSLGMSITAVVTDNA